MHGKLNTYSKHKCRCDACREAYSIYQKNWSAKKKQRREYLAAYGNRDDRGEVYGVNSPNKHHLPDGEGRLDVLCWCEKKVVKVGVSLIRAGKTGSCGREGCHG